MNQEEEIMDQESAEKRESNDRRNPAGLWIMRGSVIILALLFLLAILIYGINWRNKYMSYAMKIVPFPAVIVDNSKIITISSIDENLSSIRKFYENQDFSQVGLRVDFNTQDGVKRLKIKEKDLLNKMIEDKLIEIMANKNSIYITKEEIDKQFIAQMSQKSSQQDIVIKLKKLYGWTLDDFKEKMVKPDLYREKLTDFIKNNDPAIKEQKVLSEKAMSELKKSADFMATAKQYSFGESATEGGGLGWFEANQLMQPIADALSKMEKDGTTDIIETDLGYHIVKLDDVKNEDQRKMYKISQIFIPTVTLGDWLAKNSRDMKIRILLKDYSWNDQSRVVEFTDQDNIQFEKNLDINSAGDASLFFNN